MLPEDHRPNPRLDRRHFCTQTGAGFGSLALASMLQGQEPKLPSKAKSVIFLFMFGGPSQVDLFDYKPRLQKVHGKPVPDGYLGGKRFSTMTGDPSGKLMTAMMTRGFDAGAKPKRSSKQAAATSHNTETQDCGAPTRFQISPNTWTNWRWSSL